MLDKEYALPGLILSIETLKGFLPALITVCISKLDNAHFPFCFSNNSINCSFVKSKGILFFKALVLHPDNNRDKNRSRSLIS